MNMMEKMYEGWELAIKRAIAQAYLLLIHQDIKNAFDSYWEDNNG